jgi:Tfp pilus assembly protein PilO
MIQVSPREKALLLAATAASALYIFCTLLLFPYWDSLTEISGMIDTQAKRVVNYQKILLTQNSVRASLQDARKQVSDAEKGLLVNKSDTLASAEFQGVLRQLSAAQSLNVARTEVLPVKPMDQEYGKLAARLEVSGSLDRFVAFLASLNASERILFVEEMRISPTSFNIPKKKDVRATLTVCALKFLEPTVVPLRKS